MKFKSILVAALAAMTFVSCSNDDNGGVDLNGKDGNKAYMSVNVKIPAGTGTRGSDEGGATTEEAAINKLYAVMFDDADKVVTLGTLGATVISESTAFAVSLDAKKLLLVANPGVKLLNVLENSRAGDTFDAINAAIQGVTKTEIESSTKGFTMINKGDEGKLLANDAATTPSAAEQCLINVVIHKDDNEAVAITAAENSPTKVEVERLSSKIIVKAESVETKGTASFEFEGWVLDVLNTKFYPYAPKVKLDANHTGGLPPFYINNFYTIDPNYSDSVGLKYNDRKDYVGTANTGKWNDQWNSTTENADYCIENTMKAVEQRFMHATRLIVKATYYPEGGMSGDWFSHRGDYYKDLAELKAAYAASDASQSLKDACDNFFHVVDSAATAENVSITGVDFATLLESDLAALNTKLDGAGGELVRIDDCIRWYPEGINYYWYEIRHSNDINATMAFGKYGVVRNNFYTLNVKSVKNWGTPWYPGVDPEDPDPEGPEGPDPIDEEKGFLAVEVEVAPWITWTHDITW